MKSSLQPTSINDLNPLSDFLARAFDAERDAAFLNPAMMAWKYWDRRNDWNGPRSYVMMRDGVITAHAGLWPMTFGEGAGAVRGIHMIDWASAKEAPGAGLALVQKLAGMFDFIFSIGGSEATCKVLPSFGFVEYARAWKGVRPLRPLRQILTHQNRNWKLAPRLLRNSIWAMRRGERRKDIWKALAVNPQEIASMISMPRTGEAKFSARPPAFFEYLLRCPGIPFRLYSIVNGEERIGQFAISLVRGQARLAGLWLRDCTAEEWNTSYFLAHTTALQLREANEVVAMGSGDLSREGSLGAGFHTMPGPTVYLLDKTKRLPFSSDFNFQLADSDLAFLDPGVPSYWS